jgi:hypothetical protein
MVKCEWSGRGVGCGSGKTNDSGGLLIYNPFMTKPRFYISLSRVLLICLFVPMVCRAEQFVEVTAELEIHDWSYWFFTDEINQYPGYNKPPSIFTESQTRRCVVGTNTWFIECNFPEQQSRCWFTGTNILKQIVTTKQRPDGRNYIPPFTVSTGSADGNPFRPVRVVDALDCWAKVCWLAFCSGPDLKRDGRQVPLPSDIWKESSLGFDSMKAPEGFRDKTVVFEDTLGLPKSTSVFSKSNQTILRYQTRQSTNVLGWNFPQEFYLVQYQPVRTNEWELYLTARGRLISIGAGTMPPLPKENPNWVEK